MVYWNENTFPLLFSKIRVSLSKAVWIFRNFEIFHDSTFRFFVRTFYPMWEFRGCGSTSIWMIWTKSKIKSIQWESNKIRKYESNWIRKAESDQKWGAVQKCQCWWLRLHWWNYTALYGFMICHWCLHKLWFQCRFQ